MAAALATEPFAYTAFVIVTIEGEPIAMRTEGGAVAIIATLEASERIVIVGGVAEINGAEGVEFLVDEAEDVVKAFSGIAEDFTNSEFREAALDVFEAGQGLEVIIAIGWDEGARDRPVSKQAIVNEIEGLGLVPKVVLAARLGAGGWVEGGS